MGASLMVFGVDLDALEKVFGSNDRALLTRIEEQYAQELEDDEDPHNRVEGEPTLRQALEEILANPCSRFKDSFDSQHIRALRLICGVVGEQYEYDLPDDVYLSRAGYVLGERSVADHASFKKLINGPPPLGLPTDEDFPGCGFIGLPGVREALARLEPLDVLGLDRWVAFKLIRFHGWLKKADAAGRSLVGFYL